MHWFENEPLVRPSKRRNKHSKFQFENLLYRKMTDADGGLKPPVDLSHDEQRLGVQGQGKQQLHIVISASTLRDSGLSI